MGFFQPENAQAALACMDMMDFEGKAAVMEKIRRTAGLEGGAAEHVVGEGLGAALAGGLPGGAMNASLAALTEGGRNAGGASLADALPAGAMSGAAIAGGLSPQGAMPGGSDGAAGAFPAKALAGNGRGGLPGERNGGRKDISPRGTAVGGALPGAQAQKIALSRAQNAALLAAAPMRGGDPAGQAVKQARKRR